MSLIYPFWFKQRQCKAETAGDENTLKVSGPNLGEAFIGIARGDNNQWRAFLRPSADAPESAGTEAEFEKDTEAWQAAFELYRVAVIV